MGLLNRRAAEPVEVDETGPALAAAFFTTLGYGVAFAMTLRQLADLIATRRPAPVEGAKVLDVGPEPDPGEVGVDVARDPVEEFPDAPT